MNVPSTETMKPSKPSSRRCGWCNQETSDTTRYGIVGRGRLGVHIEKLWLSPCCAKDVTGEVAEHNGWIVFEIVGELTWL